MKASPRVAWRSSENKHRSRAKNQAESDDKKIDFVHVRPASRAGCRHFCRLFGGDVIISTSTARLEHGHGSLFE